MTIFSKFSFADKNLKIPVVGKIFWPKIAKCHLRPESRRLMMCVTPTWIYLKNRPQTRENGLFQKSHLWENFGVPAGWPGKNFVKKNLG